MWKHLSEVYAKSIIHLRVSEISTTIHLHFGEQLLNIPLVEHTCTKQFRNRQNIRKQEKRNKKKTWAL